jgi:flagellar motor protein MotB
MRAAGLLLLTRLALAVPVADNATAAGQQQNRRVEAVLAKIG